MNNISPPGCSYQMNVPSSAYGEPTPGNSSRHSIPTAALHDYEPRDTTRFHKRKAQATTSTTYISRDSTDEVVLSEQFKESITNLNRYSSKEEKQVGLIVRFNNNDNFTETFWSEQYITLEKSSLCLGYNREKVTNIVLKKTGYEISSAQPDLGGHCEEIFIRSWERLVKYSESKPRVVDIVLSLSPCMQHSTLFLDKNGHLWPAGCSPKLYKLISEQKQVVQWNIIYIQKNSDHYADAAIAKLNRHPKVKVFSCDRGGAITLAE